MTRKGIFGITFDGSYTFNEKTTLKINKQQFNHA